MKASLGRTVIFEGDIESNGSKKHPAIINRVWSDREISGQDYAAVNVTVLPDCGQPVCRTSVLLFENSAEAAKYRELQSAMQVCYFPDRV